MPEMAKRVVLGLTPRQAEYLGLVCRGRRHGVSRRDVAATAYVSWYTVKSAMARAYRELGVHSEKEACYLLGASSTHQRD